MDAGRFDIAVIGAGVIGCALTRRLALDGARVVLIEKAADILDGASKANSAILHTGFDATPGTIEAACVKAGHAEYLEIRQRLGLPLMQCGALVIAWSEEEEAALPALIAQAHANGVTDVEPLDGPALRALEPGLGRGARAAFRVPREYVIDPWSAPLAYLTQALANGAELIRGAEVTGGTFDGAEWRLVTAKGAVRAGQVVNCAGLWGDLLDEKLLGEAAFRILPRKGQFILYDKPASALAAHILLPVPSKITKGIVVCRTAFGNLLVGPTAEEQQDRQRAELVAEVLGGLRRRGEEILPALAGEEITALYAGLRPASEEKDFRILHRPERHWLTLGGIRSTGLSASLGLASRVAPLLMDARPLNDPVWPQVPMLAEAEHRPWQDPGNGEMICHCERVTRAEVEAALQGPMAATTLAGLKRRTRVTMGRCQGFHCLPKLAALTRGRLAEPIGADA